MDTLRFCVLHFTFTACMPYLCYVPLVSSVNLYSRQPDLMLKLKILSMLLFFLDCKCLLLEPHMQKYYHMMGLTINVYGLKIRYIELLKNVITNTDYVLALLHTLHFTRADT
jgi:hypothetical protein